jgi:hypothetical protein
LRFEISDEAEAERKARTQAAEAAEEDVGLMGFSLTVLFDPP